MDVVFCCFESVLNLWGGLKTSAASAQPVLRKLGVVLVGVKEAGWEVDAYLILLCIVGESILQEVSLF